MFRFLTKNLKKIDSNLILVDQTSWSCIKQLKNWFDFWSFNFKLFKVRIKWHVNNRSLFRTSSCCTKIPGVAFKHLKTWIWILIGFWIFNQKLKKKIESDSILLDQTPWSCIKLFKNRFSLKFLTSFYSKFEWNLVCLMEVCFEPHVIIPNMQKLHTI